MIINSARNSQQRISSIRYGRFSRYDRFSQKLILCIGMLGLAGIVLSGCAAGNFNTNARTWLGSPQKDGIVINNFAAVYPPLSTGKTTDILLQFSIANQQPDAQVTLESIIPQDGTGTVILAGDSQIPGTEALFSPTAPPRAATDHPLGVKATLTDLSSKVKPGLSIPVLFNFVKKYEDATAKTHAENVSIKVFVPVKLEADHGHTFQQQDFNMTGD